MLLIRIKCIFTSYFIHFFILQVNDISNKSIRSNLLCQSLLWSKLLENQLSDYEHNIQQINKPKPDTSILYLKVNIQINIKLKLIIINLKIFYQLICSWRM